MKKVFALLLAVLLASVLAVPALASGDLSTPDDDYDFFDYYDDEYYAQLEEKMNRAERINRLVSFIIAGVVIPIALLVFFTVMLVRKRIPVRRCAVAFCFIAIYTGVRIAVFCFAG